MSGIRDSIKEISVEWLADGVAEKVNYSIALVLDGEIEAAYQGRLATMPGKGTPTALGFLGADLVIRRGPNEPDANYSRRLTVAHDTWRTAGSPIAVLEQVAAYVQPTTPVIRTIGNNSIWDWLDAAGDWFVFYGSGNWNWDGHTGLSKWWRAWVVIEPGTFAQRPGTWDTAYGATWDSDTATGTWDTTATQADVAAIFDLVNTWKSAHNEGVNDGTEVTRPMVIVSFDATLFDPTQPADGVHNPDGSFGRQWKCVAGVVVPSRFAAISCWEGK